ncbi:sodium-independent sulfate anion transporter isoform X1 [Microplitis mediator]|uniref:sodium-independent sulfate anion transporter isoform X1 n=2 Tax=Microplitis mediator TaxID=375433 RepID=UPI00255526BA|nr:sodium-independent sulfate anion transporter isoform X1 [Microplitis mediator]
MNIRINNDDESSESTPLLHRDMTVPVRVRVKEVLVRKLPILGWLPLYTWGKFLQDALAGITVGLTAIPQGIAYAVVAGLPAQYGLYSSFVGCFVYLIFGSVREVTIGPTAITALLVQPFVLKFGNDFAVLMCFLCGCIITLMGLLHIGFLVNFISMPVICGFTNAAALIIGASQLHTLFGIQGRTETFIDSIVKVGKNIREIKLWDTVLGVASIITLVCLKQLPGSRSGSPVKKIMWLLSLGRNAVVVIAGIILAYTLSLYDNNPFHITGNITEGLPAIKLPPFSTEFNNTRYEFTDMVRELGGSLASVSLIAILECIAIGKTFAKGKSLDANQEMIALGLCNLLGSFVRSMPVTGSFTRTAVNYASGVKTQMGGIVTGSLVLLACGLLTSTFKFIPKCTLAAVIIVAMYYMLEFHIFRVLWRTKKIDILPLSATLVCCLLISLDYGMIIGILINLILLLYFAARPNLAIEERNIEGTEVLLVVPEQSLSFPAAEYLRERVIEWCDKKSAVPVIIDGRFIHRIDTTVAKNIGLLQADLEARNQKLIFWNWCDSAKNTLVNFDKNLSIYFRNSSNVAQLLSDEILTTTIISAL